MTLTVGSRRIADGRIQSVVLQPVVGAYELVFPLYLTVSAGEDGLPSASVLGARVTVRAGGGEPAALGFARPEQPLRLVCMDFTGTATPTLHLPVQSSQVAGLEALRDAGDLTFELSFAGTGTDEHGDSYLHGQFRISVPCSEWLQTLRGAGARNVMLLEVPLPLTEDAGSPWHDVGTNLRSAEEEYGNGNYRGCVASCRIVLDELGTVRDLTWPKALSRLAEGRNREMSKVEREEAAYAAVRHYTNLAHHAPGDGGETNYTRAEAEFILSATAAAVRLAQAG